ncbi:MAG TPA: hypothetical protein VD962_08620, partial [Rubricoccaceae bacterium]|nr:hypothetical protein [Rubricoccaceae bacterium]
APPATDRPTEPRQPLPPLRWADPDSAALAEGFEPWTPPDDDVPPTLRLYRALLAPPGLDAGLDAPARAAREAHLLDVHRRREALLRRWAEEETRAGENDDASGTLVRPRPDVGMVPIRARAVAASGPRPPEPDGAAPGHPFAGAPAPAEGCFVERPPEADWERTEPLALSNPYGDDVGYRGEGSVTRTREGGTVGWSTTTAEEAVRAHGTTAERETHDFMVAFCPGRDGLVHGEAVYVREVTYTRPAGGGDFRRRVSADLRLVGRVDDRARLVSYDVRALVTITDSGSLLGDARTTEVSGRRTGIRPWGEGGRYFLRGAGDRDVARALLEMAEFTELLRIAQEWWRDGQCVQVRPYQMPALQIPLGGATNFGLDVVHVQGGDAVVVAP